MESQKFSTGIFEKFTWKIENFSCLKNVSKIYSEPFVIGGHPWRIGLFPKGNNVATHTHLSIYLEAMQTANMSKGWSRDVKFKLFVFNQLDSRKTITNEYQHDFNAKEVDWGKTSFLKLTELHDPKRGFIVKDTCIVCAEVFVCNSRHASQTGQIEVEVARPNPEFQGPKEDSTKDADVELVSAALGRVLYFLKTRKVKDMNEQACKELQVLWDELKKFQFDLTWLEPHVQSALGMKSYVEKAMQVEKLKEDMVVLKEKLAAAELNLVAERDLLKTKGSEEIGLDSELGCGSWKP